MSKKDRSQRPPVPEALPAPAVDAHTHLDACGATSAEDVRAVLDRAESAGIGRVVTVADDIDAAMKTGCALPMGPFELLDVVGLDVSLAIERSLYSEFRQSGFAPAPLLEHLVTAGRLGRKTGHGFRDYTSR